MHLILLFVIKCSQVTFKMKPNDITILEMLGILNQLLLECLQPSISSNMSVLTGINVSFKVAALTHFHLFASFGFFL